MKKYLLILFLYPALANSQIIIDTVIYVTPEDDTVRVVTYHNAATAAFVPKVDTAAIIATKYKLDSTAAALAASVAATYATITTVNGKQATLVSATNIKTVNGNNLLGSGDVSISSAVAWGGVTGTLGDQTDLINALNLKAPLASPTFTGTVVLPASTSFTTPVIGAATGTSLAVTGAVTSSGGGIGYATGNGGTVTQATSKTTGVTLNELCGRITMNAAALAAAAEVSFVVTNSTVAATDVVIVNVQSVGTAGSYFITVGAVSAGSFAITVGNCSAGSLSQAVVLNFCIIKGVSS